MDSLIDTIASNRPASFLFALDVRKYAALSTDDKFFIYRDAVARFANLLPPSSTIFIARQDHGCELSDFSSTTPIDFYRKVISQPISSRCSCCSCQPALFDHATKVLNDLPKPCLIINFACCKSGDLNAYCSKAKGLINSGIIIACISIDGSPSLVNSCSEGLFWPFSSVNDFSATVNRQNFNLPADKPVVNLRRIGSKSITLDLDHKDIDNVDHFIIEVMDVLCGRWIAAGTTQSKTFLIETSSSIKMEENTEYSVRASAKMKNGGISPTIELPNPVFTLVQDEAYGRMISLDLKKELAILKDELKLPMIPEGERIGLKRYKYIVFGDVGAGKSSFLNSVATAFSDKNAYIGDFIVGNSDSKSTTIRLWSQTLADNLYGIDIPGVNGQNYPDEKITNLIEGNFPEELELDEKGWSSKLKPFDIKDMAHMVFFVVPVDALTIGSVQEKYKLLRECFVSYKKHGLEGIHPYLLITKADTFDRMFITDKKKIYDDSALKEQREIFCKASNFPINYTFFVANYTSGNSFRKDPVVDYTILYAVVQALTQAQANIRRSAKFLKLPEQPVTSCASPLRHPVRTIGKVSIYDQDQKDWIGSVKDISTKQSLAAFRSTVTSNVDDLALDYVFVSLDKKQITRDDESKLTVADCLVQLDGKEVVVIKKFTEELWEKLTVLSLKGESLGGVRGLLQKSTVEAFRKAVVNDLGISTFKVLDKDKDPLGGNQESKTPLKDCVVLVDGKPSVWVKL